MSRTYHPDETLELLPNGGSVLRFPASSLPEVARFVLGFGKHAEVLEPPELRTLVAEHGCELGRLYG